MVSTSGELPVLHQSGVTRIAVAAQLEASAGIRSISAMTSFLIAEPGSTRQAHALVQIGGGLHDAGLYDVTLATNTARKLHVTLPCYQTLTITQDGKEGVCRTVRGIGMFSLASQQDDTGREILQNDLGADGLAQTQYSDPTWAPSGIYLAAMKHSGNAGSAIVLYAVTATYTAIHLAALLPLAALSESQPPGFLITGLTWSPDGRWLAFEAGTPTQSNIYLLRTADVLSELGSDTSTPQTIPITASMLDKLATVSSHPSLGWSADGGSLIFIAANQKDVIQITLATHASTKVFSAASAALCSAMWIPDGKQLLFVLCQRSSEPEAAATAPRDEMYTYTPQDSAAS